MAGSLWLDLEGLINAICNLRLPTVPKQFLQFLASACEKLLTRILPSAGFDTGLTSLALIHTQVSRQGKRRLQIPRSVDRITEQEVSCGASSNVGWRSNLWIDLTAVRLSIALIASRIRIEPDTAVFLPLVTPNYERSSHATRHSKYWFSLTFDLSGKCVLMDRSTRMTCPSYGQHLPGLTK